MKKFLALIMVLALTLPFGCTPATTTIPSAPSQVENIICSPPADVMALINVAIPILAQVVAAAVPGSSVMVNAVAAQATAEKLSTAGCAAVKEVNALIAFLNTSIFKTAQAKVKAPINTQPLADWVLKAG